MNTHAMNRYSSLPPLPERLHRLDDLAVDLWWSWHADAREVFRRLDYPLWRQTAHNPVQMLWKIPRETLEAAAADETLLRIYDRAIAGLDTARAGARHLVDDSISAVRRSVDRLFLRRVRAAPVAADLCRRPRRAGWRSLQGSRRSRRAAHRRRLHVSAGILPPEGIRRRLAGGDLRAPALARTPPSSRPRPPTASRASRRCRSATGRSLWRCGECASGA